MLRKRCNASSFFVKVLVLFTFGVVTLTGCSQNFLQITISGNLAVTPTIPVRSIPSLTPAPGPTPTHPGFGVNPSNALPLNVTKPAPEEITFQGCPPQGEGGDSQQNLLKNRIDPAAYYTPITFQSIVDLPWPNEIAQRERKNWPTADLQEIQKYEGSPISIEGYLVEVHQAEPESTNCKRTNAGSLDWHLSLVGTKDQTRSESIVTEMTPRVRAEHPTWTMARLDEIVKDKTKVRISGWLMFDPDHPDYIGKTRATLWEIHPVMKLEVEKDGKWVSLDDGG